MRPTDKDLQIFWMSGQRATYARKLLQGTINEIDRVEEGIIKLRREVMMLQVAVEAFESDALDATGVAAELHERRIELRDKMADAERLHKEAGALRAYLESLENGERPGGAGKLKDHSDDGDDGTDA